MTKDDESSADALVDKFFEQKLDEVKALSSSVSREGRRRYYAAIVLKGIALLGGVVVAAAREKIVSFVVGILISIAVALDQLTSNTNLLIALTDAQTAATNLRKRVEAKHSKALPNIIELKKRGEVAEAREQWRHLLESLSSEIDAELVKIRDKLAVARRASIVAFRIHHR